MPAGFASFGLVPYRRQQELPERHGGQPDDHHDQEGLAERVCHESLERTRLVSRGRRMTERDLQSQPGHREMEERITHEPGTREHFQDIAVRHPSCRLSSRMRRRPADPTATDLLELAGGDVAHNERESP